MRKSCGTRKIHSDILPGFPTSIQNRGPSSQINPSKTQRLTFAHNFKAAKGCLNGWLDVQIERVLPRKLRDISSLEPSQSV